VFSGSSGLIGSFLGLPNGFGWRSAIGLSDSGVLAFLGLPLGFGCGSSLGIVSSWLAFLFGSGLPFGGVFACLFCLYYIIHS